ncbi:MAG: hypothetical protein ACRC8U_13730, partial [Brooklawnia sp.]
ELARPHVTRILDGRVRALKCSDENMPRKLGAHSGHESCCRATSTPENKIPALVRAGIEVAEDTRFELVRA